VLFNVFIKQLMLAGDQVSLFLIKQAFLMVLLAVF